MLVKQIGKNKYRRANWVETAKYFIKKKKWEIYSLGCYVVGAILIVFTLCIILGGNQNDEF